MQRTGTIREGGKIKFPSWKNNKPRTKWWSKTEPLAGDNTFTLYVCYLKERRKEKREREREKVREEWRERG